MARQDDPYEVLGLARGATWAEIRLAYRRLAKKHHPDKNPGDKTSEWIFKEVGRAYERLRSVHGVHSPAGEGKWREHDPGGRSDHEQRERQAREQQERDQRERAERVRREQERAEQRQREQREKEEAQTARDRWKQAKSQRAAGASREGTGRERSGTRERDWHSSIVWPIVGVAAGLAVAALVGVSRTIYDRTDAALPDRAAQSVTEIEREAGTARPRGTATVPVRRDRTGDAPPDRAVQSVTEIEREAGTARPRGTATVPVRRDRTGDAPPDRAVQSVTEIEREAETTRPRGTATARSAPVPVGRSRGPGRASATQSGPLRPSSAQVGDTTVIGWRTANPSDRSEPSPPRPSNAQVGDTTVIGWRTANPSDRSEPSPPRPSNAQVGDTTVIGWRTANPSDRSEPSPRLDGKATASAFFTRGSHEDEVLRIQGTPTDIDRYPALGHETWRYGRDTVTISTGSRRVTEWSNPTGNLNVRLIPGANVTASAFFTRGLA